MSKTKTSLLLLAAGVAGAAIGTLLAPKRGRETRADLKKRAEQLAGTLKRGAKKATDEARGKAKELKSEVRAAGKGTMSKAVALKKTGTARKRAAGTRSGR
jgi:gas vesicle protein